MKKGRRVSAHQRDEPFSRGWLGKSTKKTRGTGLLGKISGVRGEISAVQGTACEDA